jgi:hypothetical protein
MAWSDGRPMASRLRAMSADHPRIGGVILHRHAEHLADHRDRQRVRKVLDHVHATLRLHPVQQPVDDLLDVLPQGLDHPWREGLAHQRAQPRVIGRIAKQHRARQRRLLALVAVHRRQHLLELLAAESLIAQHGHAVVPAGQHVEAERTAMDRIPLAQPPVERIRVRVELRQ